MYLGPWNKLVHQNHSSYFIYFINQITVFPQRWTLYLSPAHLTSSLDMNVHPDSVFNTVIQYTRDYIPYIMAYISLEPNPVHLKMEWINQDCQDAISDYLVNTPTTKHKYPKDYW